MTFQFKFCIFEYQHLDRLLIMRNFFEFYTRLVCLDVETFTNQRSQQK